MGGLLVCWMLTGCSVVMALSGKKEPNLAAIHVGSTRQEVEMQLGQPVESIPTEYGAKTDVYEYEAGNEPSKARAFVHALYDLLTLGIYELIGTPAEASLGEMRRLPIVYGQNDRVVAINEYAPERPGAEKAVAESVTGDIGVSAQGASDVDTIRPVSERRRQDAYAVVVGIERYRENLPKADFAERDAKIVSQYLIQVLGYPEENVVVRVNDKAARTDLEKYFEDWLANHVEPANSVFIYFSGHGAPSTKTGEAYLVPYDGDPAFIEKTGYPLKRLYEYVNKLPAREVVVVLDSCFSGAGGRSVIATGMRPMALSVENPILSGGKTVVLAASSAKQVSSTYNQKGHGLLTYFFLKGIQGEADLNRDRAIDLTELFEYVRPQVERIARREFNNEQTPQLIGSPELLKRGVRLLDQGAPGTQPR